MAEASNQPESNPQSREVLEHEMYLAVIGEILDARETLYANRGGLGSALLRAIERALVSGGDNRRLNAPKFKGSFDRKLSHIPLTKEADAETRKFEADKNLRIIQKALRAPEITSWSVNRDAAATQTYRSKVHGFDVDTRFIWVDGRMAIVDNRIIDDEGDVSAIAPRVWVTAEGDTSFTDFLRLHDGADNPLEQLLK